MRITSQVNYKITEKTAITSMTTTITTTKMKMETQPKETTTTATTSVTTTNKPNSEHHETTMKITTANERYRSCRRTSSNTRVMTRNQTTEAHSRHHTENGEMRSRNSNHGLRSGDHGTTVTSTQPSAQRDPALYMKKGLRNSGPRTGRCWGTRATPL
jgi:hypothetical protein